MLYDLNTPPAAPPSLCSRMVVCISSATDKNSLSSGLRSISNDPWLDGLRVEERQSKTRR